MIIALHGIPQASEEARLQRQCFLIILFFVKDHILCGGRQRSQFMARIHIWAHLYHGWRHDLSPPSYSFLHQLLCEDK